MWLHSGGKQALPSSFGAQPLYLPYRPGGEFLKFLYPVHNLVVLVTFPFHVVGQLFSDRV